MRGVDLMDQAIQYYRYPHRSYKWWKPIFLHCFDIAVNNALIMYRIHTGDRIKHKDFRLAIMKGLLEGWTCRANNMNKSNLLAEPQQTMMRVNPQLPVINLNSLHDIGERTGYAAGACKYCSAPYWRRRTKYFCVQCQVALCPTCFKAYHAEYVYK